MLHILKPKLEVLEMDPHESDEPNLTTMKLIIEMCEKIVAFAKKNVDFSKELERYRRPIKYTERDAKIMRLKRQGKSAGQIVKLLYPQWTVTESTVRAVWGRNKKAKRS